MEREEEYQLVANFQTSTDAHERDRLFAELYEAHKGLIYKEARSLLAERNLSLNPDTIVIPYGQEGLFIALGRFNPDYGNRLMTYARWYVRKALTEGLEDLGLIPPINTLEGARYRAVGEAASTLRRQNQEQPTREEIAAWVRSEKGLPLTDQDVAMYSRQRTVSLNEVVEEEYSTNRQQWRPDVTVAAADERAYLQQTLRKATRGRPERVYKALCYRWGFTPDHETRSLNEAGRLFGFSSELLRQEERLAFRRMRNLLQRDRRRAGLDERRRS